MLYFYNIMFFYMMEKWPWNIGSIPSRSLQFGRVYGAKKYIHLTKEMNNRKCIHSSPRGYIFFDIAKGKMKHKHFLPSTLLYKRSYVLKAGPCLCQGGRSRCVCFEMWRMIPVQRADRMAGGGIRGIQDTFFILPRQKSIQDLYKI